MVWSNGMVMRFLELYQIHPCLWDPKHDRHRDKMQQYDAWVDIKNKLGAPCSIKELKKKKESLMAAYRAYRSKAKKFENSDTGTSNLYKPTWFAYSYMDAFLGPIYTYKSTINENQQKNREDNAGVQDTDDTDASNTAKEFLLASSQHQFQKSKRRKFMSTDLQQAKQQMDQACDILKSISEQHYNDMNEDECNIFGKLTAKKMCKLPADRRDLMMIKINQLFYEEFYEN